MASHRLRTRLRVFSRAFAQRLTTMGRRMAAQHPRRILIAHHLLLGDTLMLTPLMAKLRQRYPEAEIVMCLPRAYAALYQSRPYGVRAVGWNPRDAASLDELFAQSGFDLAFVPGDNRHGWLALAAGARWITAFAGDRPAYKNWPIDCLIPYPGQPAAWGDMVAQLVPGEPPAPFSVADWPAPPAAAFALPQRSYCVLHVGASTPLKQWEPDKWRTLARMLEQRGHEVVWSAGRGEEAIVTACDPEQRHASYAGKLDLAQMWQLLAGARLLVSPDTGIAHLARIAGTPAVTLFGPGSAQICGPGEFWRNLPLRAVTVPDFPCRDQRILFEREIAWVRHCARSIRECSAPRCMQAIDVAMVEAAVQDVLQQAESVPCAASRVI